MAQTRPLFHNVQSDCQASPAVEPTLPSDLGQPRAKIGKKVVTSRSCTVPYQSRSQAGAALKWRWREDLAISIIRCLLTSLKVAEKVKLERYLEKEEMVVDMVLEVAERGTRMTWVGQRAMFFTIQALLNMSIQTGQLQRLVQTTDRAVQG